MRCLAWIDLLWNIVLPIKSGYQLYQQGARRCNPKILPDIKAEITWLIEANFIWQCRYAE